jgi:hypothetical protein
VADSPTPAQPGGRTPPPGPREAVAALARQLDRLESKVDGLDIDRLRGDLRGLAITVAELADGMAEAEVRSDEPAPSWLWPADPLSRDEVESTLAQLVRWLRRVHLRYADAALPECWLWHPDVVEELVWLRGAWQAAYHGPMASAQRAGDWHDRLRPGVVRRIKACASSCSLREHLDPSAMFAVPAADAVPAIAAWWVDPAGPAPVPTGEQVLAADTALRTPVRRRWDGDR